MPPDEVLRTLKVSADLGCTEALFTFGERPGVVPGFTPLLERIGYPDILDYLYDLSLDAIRLGLLPHTNAGILSYQELDRFREVNASMGLMLETTADVAAHRLSPGRTRPSGSIMIENAGKLSIPFTTGILVGIGETMDDREESLRVIRDLHEQYGHIRKVIVQNFRPKPGTPMERMPTPGTDELCATITSPAISSPDVSVRNTAEPRRCLPPDPGAAWTTSAGSPRSPSIMSTPSAPGPELRKRRGWSGMPSCGSASVSTRSIEKGWYLPSSSP